MAPKQLLTPEAPASGATPPYGVQSPGERAETSFDIRLRAAEFERERALPLHKNNGDEANFPDRIGNYSKGLPHDKFGVVNPGAYAKLMTAVTSGQPGDFQKIPLGGSVRFVNPQAGLAFDLEGADSHALSIPPAWGVLSAERAAEGVELYCMALCRDVPFTEYATNPLTLAAIDALNALNSNLFPKIGGKVTAQTLFRGNTPGELTGPYVSQFFLKNAPFGALVTYIDATTNQQSQQYGAYVRDHDYMTDEASWLKVQNGDAGATPTPNMPFGNNIELGPRYLYSGRCGAAFVHVDELYQAYFMAALNLLDSLKFNSYDHNNPYQAVAAPMSHPDAVNQAGFGTFGNPHVATLVAEVATRALKAQWYQKWFVHRTLRPEEYGGLVHFAKTKQRPAGLPDAILDSSAVADVFTKFGTYLMPMAFPEGSPQHPSYGSGHATVAGACATIIKAFFNENMPIENPVVPNVDADPDKTGTSLVPYTGPDANKLTVVGEANKIAGNVGMFRNHAGVHWRQDHEQSILLGEQIAISILQDQKWLYNEPFTGWEFHMFDGTLVTI